MLEYRLNYLAGIVDRFVIVEGTLNFQGEPKELSQFPLGFPITHIQVTLNSHPSHSFENESKQRDAILRGLTGLKDDDLVLLGDLDEIPRREDIRSVDVPTTFLQEYYKYNSYRVFHKYNKEPEEWPGTVILPGVQLSQPQFVRGQRFYNAKIKNGGWHYSWFGDWEIIQQKLRATSHIDLNTDKNRDRERFYALLERGIDPLDNSKELRRITTAVNSW